MGEEPLGIVKIICPITGECQGQEAGVGGLRNRAGGGGGVLGGGGGRAPPPGPAPAPGRKGDGI